MFLHVLFGFLPWIAFSALYGSAFDTMLSSSFFAAALVIIFSFKELKKGFVLPVGTLVFFLILGFATKFHLFPLLRQHAMLMMNVVLALLIWVPMLFNQPFTMQYAKQNVNRAYWHSPVFIRVNWLLSLMWAIIVSIMVLPAILIPQDQYMDSWFWNYGFNVILIVIAVLLNRKLPSLIIGRKFWRAVANLPQVDSPFLQGGYKPVKDEVTLNYLEVEGQIPDGLQGRYLRNGPNPLFAPYTYTYPIDGDGMIHEISIHAKNVSYRNRFIKTKGLVAEQKAGKALYGGIKLGVAPDPKYVGREMTKNTAAINIVKWGNDLLALYEAAPAYILGKDLNTIGEWQPTMQEKFNVNAHFRTDPQTKHTYMFTYAIAAEAPYLTIYELDQYRHLIKSVPIEKLQSTMIHDLVITEHYIVVFDVPAVFNVGENQPDKPFFSYESSQKVNIILIDRKSYAQKTIIGIDSFFVYHFVNAYEENNQIIVDFIYHAALELNPTKASSHPALYRGIIDLASLTYQHKSLVENLVVEFPNYNLQRTGHKYNYAYMPARVNSTHEGGFNSILKYDFALSRYDLVDLGPDVEIGEITFVASTLSEAEDEGYLMFFAYNLKSDTSDFIIVDAANPRTTLARVKLPVRVPHGLHGSWAPDYIG